MFYDLIVVGAGSSGAVIASRVSQRTDQRVLLIEAGPDYSEDDLPRDIRDGRQNSMRAHDWGYRMRPNERMFTLFDYPRGKVVGGSSAVNTCIALRGRPIDYDEWGFPEWRFEAVLPYFKRLEHDLDFGSAAWHGDSGPLPIRRFRPDELVPWQAAFIEAGLRAGYPYCADSNDPNMPVGIGPHSMNLINGERMSVARCYLTPEARQRFELRANTQVRRLLLGSPLQLEIQTLGDVQKVQASRIVLCAGAIGTPALMLRSGIGPRASVERLGVTLAREVPGVGERLWEHPGAAVFFLPRFGVMHWHDPLMQTVLRLDDMYIQPGSRTVSRRFQLPLVTIAGHVGKPRMPARIVFHHVDKKPHIFAHALEDPDDRRAMAEALQKGVRLCLSEPMARLARPVFPKKDVLDDPAAFDTWLRKWSGTGYHPCGTVPMGVSTDVYGRVHGIDGLYVADASLMPTVPMANTNLTSIMIGEVIAEHLSATHR